MLKYKYLLLLQSLLPTEHLKKANVPNTFPQSFMYSMFLIFSTIVIAAIKEKYIADVIKI